MLKPFRPNSVQTISCAIQSLNDFTPVFVNAGGLGPNSRLKINLLDRGFQPIPDYSGDNAAIIDTNSLKAPVLWKGGTGIKSALGEVRIQVLFEGVRPEDASLYAIYLGDAG